MTGKTETDARASLSNGKLNYTITYEFNNSINEDNVIQQNPSAGASVTEGTVVAVVVSKGKEAPSGWTEDASFKDSKWYTCEKKEQYLKQTRTADEYVEWGVQEEFTSQRSTSVTYRYVKTYEKVTGSHEEWYLKRWWNGSNFKDQPLPGYSLDYKSGWYRKDQIWEAAVPRWNHDRWHLVGEAEDAYPYIHEGTRTVDDKTTYYVYQKGTKKIRYGSWSDGEWVDDKPKETTTCRIKSKRTLYKYTAK